MQPAPAAPRFPAAETIVPDRPAASAQSSGPLTVMGDEGCGAPLSETDKTEIVERCVAEVLEILARRNER